MSSTAFMDSFKKIKVENDQPNSPNPVSKNSSKKITISSKGGSRKTVFVYDPNNPRTPDNNRTPINLTSDSERTIDPNSGNLNGHHQSFNPEIHKIANHINTNSRASPQGIYNPVNQGPYIQHMAQHINAINAH
jgi:hypothetical protein